jgi:hypothetical protein
MHNSSDVPCDTELDWIETDGFLPHHHHPIKTKWHAQRCIERAIPTGAPLWPSPKNGNGGSVVHGQSVATLGEECPKRTLWHLLGRPPLEPPGPLAQLPWREVLPLDFAGQARCPILPALGLAALFQSIEPQGRIAGLTSVGDALHLLRQRAARSSARAWPPSSIHRCCNRAAVTAS